MADRTANRFNLFHLFALSWMLTVAPASTMAQLRGVIVRDVIDPFNTGESDSLGIATDGTQLFVANRDGTVRVADLATLQTNRMFDLSLESLHGLEYHDGILYATERELSGQLSQPGRIYRVAPGTGEILSFFDAPEDGITELAFGPDGLLYVADGYRDRGTPGGKVHVFSPTNGSHLLTAASRIIPRPDPTLPPRFEIAGGKLVDWLPDARMLYATSIDTPFFSGIDGQTLLFNGFIPIEGLPEQEFDGVDILGDRMYLLSRDLFEGQLVNRFFEVQMIPEPHSVWLTIAALCMAVLSRRNRR